MILGDAFLARVKENDEEFERMDFTLSDISSNAQWMADALKHQKEKINRPMAQDILKNMKSKSKQPTASPSDLSRERGKQWI